MVSAGNHEIVLGYVPNITHFLGEEIFFEDVLSAAICFEMGGFLYSSKNFTRSFLS